MSLTPYANELITNFMLTTQAVVRPTAWYLAWHIGTPGDDGLSNEQTVANDANYARQPVTFDSGVWNTVTKKMSTVNNILVNIVPAAATSYTIYGFSIWDSLTGGNCIMAEESVSPLAVSDVVPLIISAGDIPISLSRVNAAYSRTESGASLVTEWLLTTNAVTRPTAWYAALHTGDPGDDGSLNEVTLTDDPDYARKAIVFNPAATVNGDTYTKNNTAAMWIPGSGANFSVPYISVWDSLAGGSALITSAADPVRPGVDGQTLAININNLTITEKG